jgi:hypothetical protein
MDNKDLIIENLKLKNTLLQKEIDSLSINKAPIKRKLHVKNVENIKGYEDYKKHILEFIDFSISESVNKGEKLVLTSKQVSEGMEIVGIKIKSHTCGKIMTHLYKGIKSNVNGTNYYNFVK